MFYASRDLWDFILNSWLILFFCCVSMHAHTMTYLLRRVYCRAEDRAAGWILLTREILKLPEAPSVSGKENQTKAALPPRPTKDKGSSKLKRPQPLIKLVMRRFKNKIIYCSAVWICAGQVLAYIVVRIVVEARLSKLSNCMWSLLSVII